MFVHISPEPDAIGETISTLKFAERVATVELGAARVNKDGADVKALKEQVFTLFSSKCHLCGSSKWLAWESKNLFIILNFSIVIRLLVFGQPSPGKRRKRNNALS